MSVINFEHEFDRFLFRSKQADIFSFYERYEKNCCTKPTCVQGDIWEVELVGLDFSLVIKANPSMKATGYILNWDDNYVYIAYSHSGSATIDQIEPAGPFDKKAESHWYDDCPIATKSCRCKEFYISSGTYERFTYKFPYSAEWDEGIDASKVVPSSSRDFDISPIGTLNKCKSKQSVVQVPDGVLVIGSYSFCADDFGFKANTTLTNLILPNTVKKIDSSAFANCKKLSSITLPEGLEIIESDAFSRTEIKELTLPMTLCEFAWDSLRDSKITNIQVPENHPVFAQENGCVFNKQTHTLIFASFTDAHITIPDGIKILDYRSIADHKKLKRITIPKGLQSIGSYAFDNCKALQQVDIPLSVTKIGTAAFCYCTSLKQINIPDSVEEIESAVFQNCSSLQQITLPKGLGRIASHLFASCFTLQQITIPQSVSEIELEAFKFCESLQQITIPSNVTEIGAWAFSGCSSLQQITIPKSIRVIDDSAFSRCDNLSDVFYAGTTDDFSNIKIGKDNDALLHAVWHYEVTRQ